MATANKRPLAVLNVKRYRRIGDFILKVRTVILNITNNSALFTTPAPTIIVVTDNLQKLEDAEATAQTRVAGSVAERNINYDLVLENIRNWIIYVQTLANNAPDEPEAIHIIESAGFDVKKRGVRVKHR
ncbi:MAG: hypothetical protein IPJ79_08110 [Bacteroidetes bacterium]|nr:hypothetical protein [Bacteroidota bacterium]